MDHPVGISFLGGFLIIVAAGVLFALLAQLLRRTGRPRLLLDSGFGIAGGYLLIFLLPMKGYALGNMIGWPATVILGAALPIAALHLVYPPERR